MSYSLMFVFLLLGRASAGKDVDVSKPFGRKLADLVSQKLFGRKLADDVDVTKQPGWIDKEMFEMIGKGYCLDGTGEKGSGDEEPTLEEGKDYHPLEDEVCMRRCAAIDWCKAYSDVGISCEYYRVVVESSDGTSGGTCYKKRTPPSETASPATQAVLGSFTLLGALMSFIM